MLYELILINEIEQRAKIIFLSVFYSLCLKPVIANSCEPWVKMIKYKTI